MSGRYARVTVLGEARNLEMLLPTSRPVGELLPSIVELMADEPNGMDPAELTVTPIGAASLTVQQSLQSAGVRDGALLSLDRRDEVAPSPVVYDLAEETADRTTALGDRWQLDGRRLIAVALTTLFFTAAVLGVADQLPWAQPYWWTLAAAVGLIAVMAVIPQRLLATDLELLCPSAVLAAVTVLRELSPRLDSVWLVPGWLALALIGLALSHRHWRGTLTVAVTASLLGGLWWACSAVFGPGQHTAGVAGVGTVLLLGLVPRLTLTLSGLTSLDDRLAQDTTPRTPHVHTAIRQAHRGMAGAILLLGLSGFLAVHEILTVGTNAWALGLAGVITVLMAVRARSMPWPLERAALLTAAAGGALTALVVHGDRMPFWFWSGLLVVLGLVTLGLRLLTVPAHVAARLRITGRRLETLATLALIPLLVGSFDLYTQLVTTFQD